MPFPDSHRAGNSRCYSLGSFTLFLALPTSQTDDSVPWGLFLDCQSFCVEGRGGGNAWNWPDGLNILLTLDQFVINPKSKSWKLSMTRYKVTLAGPLIISDWALSGLDLITANWVIFYLSSLLKNLSQTLPFYLVSWRSPQ